MRYGAMLIVCILLASCATMKERNSIPNHEGPCKDAYYDAQTGEKEALAGTILLPAGIVIGAGVWGIPFAVGPIDDPAGVIIPTLTFSVLGGLMMLAGVITLVDGHRRVDKWNDYCVGGTAAERYCLFEPLPTSRGKTP